MARLLLLSIFFIAFASILHANCSSSTNIYLDGMQATEPDSTFGYKKVRDKSGYNFEDKDGNKIFSKPILDGYPLSRSYFAVLGKNRKYALFDTNEKYVTKFIYDQLYRMNDDFFGIDKNDLDI